MEETYPVCDYEKVVERIMHLQELFKIAGNSNHKVSMSEIVQCDTIKSMPVSEVNSFDHIHLKIPKASGVALDHEQDILVASSAFFGQNRLLHLAMASVRPTEEKEQIRLNFLKIAPKEIRMMNISNEHYETTLMKASKTYKTLWTIRSEPPLPTDQNTPL